jgi:hypothetical protein
MVTADEILASIRRLPLPERLRLIRLAAQEAAYETPLPPAVAESAGRTSLLSVDDLLAARHSLPPGAESVSLADMERAIAEGASGHASV